MVKKIISKKKKATVATFSVSKPIYHVINTKGLSKLVQSSFKDVKNAKIHAKSLAQKKQRPMLVVKEIGQGLGVLTK